MPLVQDAMFACVVESGNVRFAVSFLLRVFIDLFRGELRDPHQYFLHFPSATPMAFRMPSEFRVNVDKEDEQFVHVLFVCS